jgi:hypothetical protein
LNQELSPFSLIGSTLQPLWDTGIASITPFIHVEAIIKEISVA